MADMRSCSKTGCRWPASATLSYRYASAEVWLQDLAEDHPATHDLCPHHADALVVPRGWTVLDSRDPAEAPVEPSAAEIVERATNLRNRVDAMLTPAPRQAPRQSRYEALLETLPVNARAELQDLEDEERTAEVEDRSAALVPGSLSRANGVRPAPAMADRVLGPPSSARTTEDAAVIDLEPVIRQIAADLAGPVVGTIKIDLTDRVVSADTAAAGPEVAARAADGVDPTQPGAHAAHPAAAEPASDARVLRLPLRHHDSTVE